jgi:hypothetical protein
MRGHWLHSMFVLLLSLVTGGCQDGTDPSTVLVLSGPADLTAVVFQTTHESGPTPGGYVSQYAVWIGSSGAMSADAGLVVGAATPVFLSSNGKLTRASAAAITVGDVIQVWRDASVAYGAVEAPPGKPCYTSTQVVILR